MDACQAVGMPRSSFYSTLDHNPEVIADIQVSIDTQQRQQLVLIFESMPIMLSKLIEDGLSTSTSPRDRLAIFSKLNELANNYSSNLQVNDQLSNEAQAFLKRGPTLVPAKSKLTATERTITLET